MFYEGVHEVFVMSVINNHAAQCLVCTLARTREKHLWLEPNGPIGTHCGSSGGVG